VESYYSTEFGVGPSSLLPMHKSHPAPVSDARETMNLMLVRSSSMEDLVMVDLMPCCSVSPSSPFADLMCPLSLVDAGMEPATTAKDLVDNRIQGACLNIYTLAFVQFINLMFIYMWLSLSTQRSQFVVVAEALLSFTPLSGMLGAFFKNRVWLETFHMTSMLLYCSPLFFAMAIWDVDHLSNIGYAFFTYQILLLFYQYKALKIVLQLRRDIKLRSLMQSPIVKA